MHRFEDQKNRRSRNQCRLRESGDRFCIAVPEPMFGVGRRMCHPNREEHDAGADGIEHGVDEFFALEGEAGGCQWIRERRAQLFAPDAGLQRRPGDAEPRDVAQDDAQEEASCEKRDNEGAGGDAHETHVEVEGQGREPGGLGVE